LHAARHDRRARRDRRGVRRRSLAVRRRAESTDLGGAGALHGRAVADQGAHSDRRPVCASVWAVIRMTRWRTTVDRVLVLAIILAAWQIGSAMVGPYWLSSPWAVASHFVAQTLSGELIRQSSFTIWESVCGALVGGMP